MRHPVRHGECPRLRCPAFGCRCVAESGGRFAQGGEDPVAFFVGVIAHEERFGVGNDFAPDTLGENRIGDALVALAGAPSGQRTDLEQKNEVDAVVVILFEIKTPAVSGDTLVEIGALPGDVPAALVNGAPEPERFRVVGTFRLEYEKNLLGLGECRLGSRLPGFVGRQRQLMNDEAIVWAQRAVRAKVRAPRQNHRSAFSLAPLRLAP